MAYNDNVNFTEEEIINYENDIKHGVIHGVLTYVIACVINPEIVENLSERIQDKNLSALKQKVKLSNSPLEILGEKSEITIENGVNGSEMNQCQMPLTASHA